MLIRPWKQRSQETANLFNPPFCCSILTAAVVSYVQEIGTGMPFPLAFISLPVILHKHTRESLPVKTTTSLAAWLEEKPVVRVQFYERAIAMKPFVREGILFGIQSNWLFLESGNIKSRLSNNDIQRTIGKTEGEARACILKARMLGKWFALAGSPETVMALWEIRP